MAGSPQTDIDLAKSRFKPAEMDYAVEEGNSGAES